MGYIIYKMGNQVPKTLFGLYIFLSAYLTKPAMYGGSAV